MLLLLLSSSYFKMRVRIHSTHAMDDQVFSFHLCILSKWSKSGSVRRKPGNEARSYVLIYFMFSFTTSFPLSFYYPITFLTLVTTCCIPWSHTKVSCEIGIKKADRRTLVSNESLYLCVRQLFLYQVNSTLWEWGSNSATDFYQTSNFLVDIMDAHQYLITFLRMCDS